MPLQVNEAVIWQDTADGISVYHIETGEFLMINGTGAQVWALLADGGAREPVTEQLALLYAGTDAGRVAHIRSEIDSFIDSMIEQGLIDELT